MKSTPHWLLKSALLTKTTATQIGDVVIGPATFFAEGKLLPADLGDGLPTNPCSRTQLRLKWEVLSSAPENYLSRETKMYLLTWMTGPGRAPGCAHSLLTKATATKMGIVVLDPTLFPSKQRIHKQTWAMGPPTPHAHGQNCDSNRRCCRRTKNSFCGGETVTRRLQPRSPPEPPGAPSCPLPPLQRSVDE